MTQKEGVKDPSIAQQSSYFEIVLAKIAQILGGFDEAKQSIKLVGSKNTQVKSLLEQLERDLNTLRSKSRRQQIQANMHLPTSNSGTAAPIDSMRTFEL